MIPGNEECSRYKSEEEEGRGKRQYKACYGVGYFSKGMLIFSGTTGRVIYSSELLSEERKEEAFVYRLQSPVGQRLQEG